MHKDISYQRNNVVEKMLDKDFGIKLARLEYSIKKIKNHYYPINGVGAGLLAQGSFTEEELKAFLNLVQLTRLKYCAYSNLLPITQIDEPIKEENLLDEFTQFYWGDEKLEADPYRKLGLIKLVTSSKRMEQNYYHLCQTIRERLNANIDHVIVKTSRELNIEGFAKTLAILNGMAVGLMLAGTFIAANVMFFGLPALTAFGVSLIFLSLGSIISARLSRRSLPEIFKKVLGRKQLFDGMHEADENLKDISPQDKTLTRRQKILLRVGVGFASCTGILTSTFSFSTITGFFAAFVSVFPVMSIIWPALMVFAVALWIANGISVLSIMYRSIYQLISIPNIKHRFIKNFLQLWDPDAACHREQNKSAFRVYVEAILICLITPLAMIGLAATVLGFIPGLSQFAAKIIPHAPGAIIDGVSYVIGSISGLGELPFNLKTTSLGIKESGEKIADAWDRLKAAFRSFKDGEKLTFSKFMDKLLEVGYATGWLLSRVTYAIGQAIIALIGGRSIFGPFGWVTASSACNTAFCEADEGSDILHKKPFDTSTYTKAIHNFNQDIGRADRIEMKHLEAAQKANKVESTVNIDEAKDDKAPNQAGSYKAIYYVANESERGNTVSVEELVGKFPVEINILAK